MHGLTNGDREILNQLGIAVVVDLRDRNEREARPNRLPAGVEVVERTSPPTNGRVRTLEDLIVAGEFAIRGDEYMKTAYIATLDRLGPELRAILERAADSRSRPLVFHCASGKDRTGIAAAVLLGILGVPEDVILDEYELTSVLASPRRLKALSPLLVQHGVSEARMRSLLDARRSVLATMLRHVVQHSNGFDGYAIAHAGVAPNLPDRLRDSLLVP
jgi:protein-tyrosine phosphatase